MTDIVKLVLSAIYLAVAIAPAAAGRELAFADLDDYPFSFEKLRGLLEEALPAGDWVVAQQDANSILVTSTFTYLYPANINLPEKGTKERSEIDPNRSYKAKFRLRTVPAKSYEEYVKIRRKWLEVSDLLNTKTNLNSKREWDHAYKRYLKLKPPEFNLNQGMEKWAYIDRLNPIPLGFPYSPLEKHMRINAGLTALRLAVSNYGDPFH